MTAILADRRAGLIAGDRRVSEADTVQNCAPKVRRVGSLLVGFCGSATPGYDLLHALQDGTVAEFKVLWQGVPRKHDLEFLILDGNQLWHARSEPREWLRVVDRTACIGHVGALVAYRALLSARIVPVQAARLALRATATATPHVGGRSDVLTFRGRRG